MPCSQRQASLQFQPTIKRPQAPSKSNKPKQFPASSSSAHKSSSSNTAPLPGSTGTVGSTPTPAGLPEVPTQRSTIEDWYNPEDDAGYVYEENRARARREQREQKKKKPEARVVDWDDVYDLSTPNEYAKYKESDEQHRELRDWKAKLYYYKRSKNAKNSDENNQSIMVPKRAPIADFGPPAAFTPSPAIPPVDASGDDAYMRRMRMSGPSPAVQSSMPPPPPPAQQTFTPGVAPATASSGGEKKADVDIAAKQAKAVASIAEMKAKMAAVRAAGASTPSAPSTTAEITQVQPVEAMAPPPPPPVNEPGVTIAKAPVRYNVPPSAASEAPPDAQVPITTLSPSSNQPSKSGSGAHTKESYGQRLLRKQGWASGKGLGKEGEGITTALSVKPDKRKKLPDHEGGGFAAPKNMGKIVGGKRRKIEQDDEDDGGPGKLSEVVKLAGMCKGMDLDEEIQENNLYGEIGGQMGEFGQVERLVIWRQEQGGNDDVFVKFTSPMSALKCVQGSAEMMDIAGNSVVAKYHDKERFEEGDYE